MRSPRVLGISIGTRTLGIVIAEKYSIYYCQMRSFKDSWSPQKLKAILAAIESYTTKYRVDAIALKIPPVYSHSSGITELLKGIKTMAKVKRLQLYTYSLLQLKNAWSSINHHPTKKQLMETILQKYNLIGIYKKEMRNKIRYYEKLFEAVGVADILLRLYK